MRWTILMFCCYISCHCALRPTPRDLTAYINRDIYGVAELENLALKRYDEMTGANYISDQALRDALDTTIIPVFGRFADLVGNITPQTPAVKKLHAKYRNAAALRLQGFRTVLLAIDTQDPDLIRQANRMLDQGQGMVQQWQKELTAIVQQYGIEIK